MIESPAMPTVCDNVWRRREPGLPPVAAPWSASMKEPPKRPTVTYEQLSYSNMLTVNALVELLTEKGVLTKPEIIERIKKLQGETKVGS